MSDVSPSNYGVADLYITAELDRRASAITDYRQEILAIQDLAARMAVLSGWLIGIVETPARLGSSCSRSRRRPRL
jgi:hypothetical protein